MSRSSPLWPAVPRIVLHYAVAILAVAAAVVAGLLLDHFLQAAPVVSLFLCMILLAAWLGGAGPGLLATALSILALDYYFIPPLHSFAVAPQELPRIVLFAIAALFSVWVCAAPRRTAESLRRARDERELRDLIETMPAVAVAALPDGSPTFVNRRWTEYTGLSAEDTVGSGWKTAIHPEDFERWLKLWRACLATGQPFEDEVRFRRVADGEYRWFWTRGVPLRDKQGNIAGWYGLGMDIQDRKYAEQERERLLQLERQAERELRVTIDTIPALVARYRPDGSPDFVNETWRTYIGLSQDSLRGQRAEIKRGWIARFAATQAHLASAFPEPVEIPRMRRGRAGTRPSPRVRSFLRGSRTPLPRSLCPANGDTPIRNPRRHIRCSRPGRSARITGLQA